MNQNFYAVGLNYRAHIEWATERHHLPVKIPTQPDVGYRSPNARVPTGADIVIPRDSTAPSRQCRRLGRLAASRWT